MGIVVVLVGLAVTSAALAALVPWLDGLADAERARNAADAAALAAVTGGRPAADAFARRHGAAVVGFVQQGDTVTVTVTYDDATAVARATNGP